MTITQLGRYEILGILGEGAMGVVYKARDPLIERSVAIKTVSFSGLTASESEAFEQRFYREARSAGCLNHRNIVTIHDVGKSDDLAYIAMELLEGQSLRQILDSGVVLTPEKAAKIATQVADGLAFAHRSGVVHRDIKPANIMVQPNGRVKIADFGVALLPAGSRTLAGTVMGSPRYMSPEQILGKVVDGRSDIFSLGVVLYEMLSGVAPFEGEDLNAIFYRVINDIALPPSTRNRKVPAALDRIVARAMCKVPGERYSSARRMGVDLREFLDQESAPAPSPGPEAEKREAEKRAAASAAGAATVLLTPPGMDAAKTAVATSTGKRRALFVALPLAAMALALAWQLQKEPDEMPAAPTTPPAVLPLPVAETPKPPEESEQPPVRVAEPPARPEREERKPAPPLPGRLVLAITPWGEIHVDGKMLGVSPPLNEISLPAGKHSIEIRNTAFPARRENINLDADATLRIKHKFQ